LVIIYLEVWGNGKQRDLVHTPVEIDAQESKELLLALLVALSLFEQLAHWNIRMISHCIATTMPMITNNQASRRAFIQRKYKKYLSNQKSIRKTQGKGGVRTRQLPGESDGSTPLRSQVGEALRRLEEGALAQDGHRVLFVHMLSS